MSRLLHALFFGFLVVAVAEACPVQNPRKFEKNSFFLTATLPNEVIKVGQQVILVLKLTNVTNWTDEIMETYPHFDFQIEVTDPMGRQLPLTDGARRLLEGPHRRYVITEVAAGKAVRCRVDLASMFQLLPGGKYTVHVRRIVDDVDLVRTESSKLRSDFVEAKPCTFTIE